jgi:hypothetical protein
MSINLFKKFHSPNTVKRIYLYLYREINKEVARKQYKIMALEIKRGKNAVRHQLSSNRRYLHYVHTKVYCHFKDGYRMFKAERRCKPITIGRPFTYSVFYKQIRLQVLTVKELRGMLQMNKIKGRSKLKTKQDMIVALMKM